MLIDLNHTIVAARDRDDSARFLTEMFGLPDPTTFGHFVVVEASNGVSLDFLETEDVHPQHYCFLVADDDFDAIYARIIERGLDHWADPGRTIPDEINHNDDGRGVYFADPNGHLLEAITRPYGSGVGR